MRPPPPSPAQPMWASSGCWLFQEALGSAWWKSWRRNRPPHPIPPYHRGPQGDRSPAITCPRWAGSRFVYLPGVPRSGPVGPVGPTRYDPTHPTTTSTNAVFNSMQAGNIPSSYDWELSRAQFLPASRQNIRLCDRAMVGGAFSSHPLG